MKIYKWIFISILLLGTTQQSFAANHLFSLDMFNCDLRVVSTADGLTQAVRLIEIPGLDLNCSAFGHGLATKPGTNELWGLIKLMNSNAHRLIRINPTSGAILQILNPGDSFESLTFNTSGSVLYAVTDESSPVPETLFQINQSNAGKTPVCTLGNGDTGEAIAFNTDDGLIYHASGTSQNKVFEKVNPGTCQITNIGFFHPDFGIQPTALVYTGSNHFFMGEFSTLFDLTTTGQVSNACDCRFLDHATKGLAFANATLTFTDLGLGGICSRQGKNGLTERLTIRNQSSITATNVVLETRLPSTITYVSDSRLACSAAGSLLKCQIGNLPPSTTVTLDITYKVTFDRKTKVQHESRLISRQYETAAAIQNNFLNFNSTCTK
jgi:hypothetical protein